MIKFIHKVTGAPMWVADDRKDEYIGAGHKLAPIHTETPAEKPHKDAEQAIVKAPEKVFTKNKKGK